MKIHTYHMCLFIWFRLLHVILVFSNKGQRYLRVKVAVPLFGSVACLRRMVADEGKLSPDQVSSNTYPEESQRHLITLCVCSLLDRAPHWIRWSLSPCLCTTQLLSKPPPHFFWAMVFMAHYGFFLSLFLFLKSENPKFGLFHLFLNKNRKNGNKQN